MAKNRKSTPSKKQRQEQLAQQQAARQRLQMIIGGAVILVIAGLLIWQLWPEPEPQVLTGERPLASIDPFARNDFYDAYPETVIDESKDYQAVIRTEKGDITFDLYTRDAPLTVNNFVFLANQGFYDGTTFHRVLEQFMAQAGDPTGTGAGGPGYNFADEVDNGLAFNRPGLLAMANAGAGTNGSQFFITFSVEQTQHLTGAHTIFGELVDGQDVLDAIALRDPNTATAPGDLIERIDILEK